VARVRHSRTEGHPQDWEAAGRCWQKLELLGKHLTGRTLKEVAPVILGKDSLEGVRLLHVTRRTGLAFSADERSALEKVVESAGTVLVDPHAGSPAFAKEAQKELEAIFGPLQAVVGRSGPG
jgi:hypothetical protein